MKKFIIVFFILETLVFTTSISIANSATEETTTTIIETQKNSLNISDFLQEAEKYTNDANLNIDLNELLSSAITGKIDNVKLIKLFWGLFGKEVLNSLTSLAGIIVIIVVHSILKAIVEGLENKSISQIAYFVQYILISTIILKNFSEIVETVKISIQNLVGFMNSLIPILITLLISTGNITSAGLLQPIILFMITLIGNFITTAILPIVLISTALGIVSQISDKVQIDKLSKFFKTSAVWVMRCYINFICGCNIFRRNFK